MKNIVLAAGYATRMYPLTENFPKPLLAIGDSTILDKMLKDVDAMPCVDEHIIVTNHKFYHIFEEWAAKAQEEARYENHQRQCWQTNRNGRHHRAPKSRYGVTHIRCRVDCNRAGCHL